MSEGKKRLLVVDDEPAVRDLVQALLVHEGHDVETASCAKEALIMIDQRSFDLVFTDYLMPEMNGQELACEIKKRKPSMPVVLVTGHRPEGTPAELACILHKPFSRHELLKTVTGLTQS
jgi:DNA-binding NtrC family response regulator